MRRGSVLKDENAQDVVFNYEPRPFPLVASPIAKEFVSAPSFQSSDFQLNPLAAEQAGVAQLRRDALDEQIEAESLAQLKQVQEKAYAEAYALGLTEGRNLAVAEQREFIAQRLDRLDQCLAQAETMKKQLLADHEAQFIKMVHELAQRIAMREIQIDPQVIVDVLKAVVGEVQDEQNLVVRLSPKDFEFVEQMRGSVDKASPMLAKVRLEAEPGVAEGGCRVESNYGVIDATIAMRVQRAWDLLAERLPRAEARTPGVGGKEGS